MTISSSLRRAGPYNGNDSATAFPFGFKVFTKADVLVTLTDPVGLESVLVLDSDYTVVLSSDQDSQPGGTVDYPVSGAPLPTGYKITLSGNLPYSQPTDIQNSGGFYPQVIEDALDRVTVQTQQLSEQMSRTVKVNISDPTPPDQLFASVLARANASADAAAEEAAAAEASKQGADAVAAAAAGFAGNASSSAAAAAASAQEAAEALTDIASHVTVVPSGNITATNVQDALVDLDTDIQTRLKVFALDALPTSDQGDIYVSGLGHFVWDVAAGAYFKKQDFSTLITYTASGSITIPSYIRSVRLSGCSGGGGGGSYGGAGSGASLIDYELDVTPGATYAITIGGGGAGGNQTGSEGGATTFGSLVVLTGGGRGSSNGGGGGGTGPAGSIAGQAGVGANSTSVGGSGGSTPFGPGSGMVPGSSLVGNNAAGYGSGGGGGRGSGGAGNGQPGILWVRY